MYHTQYTDQWHIYEEKYEGYIHRLSYFFLFITDSMIFTGTIKYRKYVNKNSKFKRLFLNHFSDERV